MQELLLLIQFAKYYPKINARGKTNWTCAEMWGILMLLLLSCSPSASHKTKHIISFQIYSPSFIITAGRLWARRFRLLTAVHSPFALTFPAAIKYRGWKALQTCNQQMRTRCIQNTWWGKTLVILPQITSQSGIMYRYTARQAHDGFITGITGYVCTLNAAAH